MPIRETPRRNGRMRGHDSWLAAAVFACGVPPNAKSSPQDRVHGVGQGRRHLGHRRTDQVRAAPS